MTGVPDTPSFNVAAADGVTTVFNFTFFVYEADDVKVYSVLNDVETEITSGITKAINTSFIGGSVTFSVAPADALGDILIRREVGYTQDTEFADITRLKETAIETALNVLALQIQQLRSNSELSPKYSEAAGVTDLTIQTPVDNAFLSFNGTTGLIASTLLSSISLSDLDTALSGIAENDILVYDGTNFVNETPAEARTSLGMGSLAVKDDINNDDWSGADLEITNGGTGASTAAAARTNLSLYSQTEVDALIDAISSVSDDTSQATTSGAIKYFDKPSGAKGAIIMVDGVSGSTSANLLVQVKGSGSLETTGYDAISTYASGSPAASTTGFNINLGSSSNNLVGKMRLDIFDVDDANHKIIADHMLRVVGGGNDIVDGAGVKTLTGQLTQLAISCTAGAFDAGSVNVIWIY